MASPMTIHGRVSKMDTMQMQANSKSDTRPPEPPGRKDSKWEILTNLEAGQNYSILPKKIEGLLTKKRKWPMKGWHKRYFVLDKGYLHYGKSANELKRGRTLGRIDVGMAVISAKPELFRLDIDDENFIHHLRAVDTKDFGLWLEHFQQHRFYRQNQINSMSDKDGDPSGPSSPMPRNSLPRGAVPPGHNGLKSMTFSKSAPLQEFTNMDERMTNKLLSVQQQAVNLGLLAQKMEEDCGSVPSSYSAKNKSWLPGLRKKKSGQNSNTMNLTSQKSDPASESRSSTLVSNSTATLDPQRAGSPPLLIDIDIPENDLGASNLSNSNPSLNSASRPSSMNLSMQTKEELINLVQDLQSELTSLVRLYTGDKERLKTAIVSSEEYQSHLFGSGKGSTLGVGNMHQMASLKNTLNQVMQQNSSLKSKLQQINLISQVDDLPQIPSIGITDTVIRGFGNPSLSYSSSCISEFFDAREYASHSDDSSDEEEDNEIEDDENEANSTDDEQPFEEAIAPSSMSTEFESLDPQSLNSRIHESPNREFSSEAEVTLSLDEKNCTLTRMTGRRQKLPTLMPDNSSLNLWNLLCKNIGKDLSKISMPVTLNEPLSALQRLCEELEYSELLDKAAVSTDPVDRMTLVAAFAVSAYGYCTARAGHKPFNPLLGETFECIRDDKGFKYIAEQVSHHPPVSACHAFSKNWTWWQDLRVKTKFWGKSMEFQPDGIVHLKLDLPDGTQELYTWNKITTCIHNLFSSGTDRWADLYGECQVKCKVNDETTMTCKLEFLKASGYWTSGKKHEVVGSINNSKGKVLQHLFGICTEALYCGQAPSARCIWRPGALPNDCELFYGFSRFAIELNEILESERTHLPKTDTRFRPDQRALEEGQISEAETLKLKLEQTQRERRLAMEESGTKHTPNWFVKKDDKSNAQWTFISEAQKNYWNQRNEAKFVADMNDLW